MCNCHITYELVTDCLWKYVGIVHESLFEAGTFYGQEQPDLYKKVLKQVAVYENSSGSYM